MSNISLQSTFQTLCRVESIFGQTNTLCSEGSKLLYKTDDMSGTTSRDINKQDDTF